jgi:hypothetical protein
MEQGAQAGIPDGRGAGGRARLCRHPGSAACRVQGFILTALAASPNRLREERYKLPLGTRHINAVLVPSEPAGPANSKREIYRVTWSRTCKLALQHFDRKSLYKEVTSWPRIWFNPVRSALQVVTVGGLQSNHCRATAAAVRASRGRWGQFHARLPVLYGESLYP